MATIAPAPIPSRAPARSQKKLVGFIAFVLLTLFVTYGKNHEILNPNSRIAQHFAPGMVFLIPHAIFASIALFAGLFQFSTRLRTAYPAFHRRLGYVYAVCVFIGAPMAVLLTPRLKPGGLLAAALLQSFGWMFCTGVAIWCIRNGNVADHRRWMMRGYPFAVVFTAARAIIPLPPVLAMGDLGVQVTVYSCIALAGFLPSIFLDWPKMPKRKAA